MGYFDDGRQVRASTKKTDREAAQAVLDRTLEDVRRGEATPQEHRLRVGDLWDLLRVNYEVNQRRSRSTVGYVFRHVLDYFGPRTKAIRLTSDRLERYVQQRQTEGAAIASINMELAMIGRAFTLAIRAKRIGRNRMPYLPKLTLDPSRVRQGFLTRQEVDTLRQYLPTDLADVVHFLFWSTWRVGEARTLQWRDYDRTDRMLRLRPEHSKNQQPRVLPVEGELATVIERRLKVRRLDCPYIFHRNGLRIGDFRKLWAKACPQAGLSRRIVHDLRRSGVKHLINAGVDPHTVMAFSGHLTPSMLRRYHIIDVADMRRAALKSTAYQGEASTIVPLRVREGEPT
jgi:integrase